MIEVAQIGDGAIGLVSVLIGSGVEHDVCATQASLHLHDLFTFDVQILGNLFNLRLGEVQAMCVAVFGVGFEALFHGAKIEKKLALGLGGGHFHHAPVFQDVFVYLCLDPMHGITHQAHPLFGIKTFDRFHEAHIALLNEVGMRQAVAQVLSGHRDHQAQMRHDQFSRRFQVVVVFEEACKSLLLL